MGNAAIALQSLGKVYPDGTQALDDLRVRYVT